MSLRLCDRFPLVPGWTTDSLELSVVHLLLYSRKIKTRNKQTMKLLTQEILKSLPALNATDNIPIEEKVIQVKFFCPWNNWTWYGVEYDPQEHLFFGLVHGFEKEWGYFFLDELQSIKGPPPWSALGIERDLHFKPCKVSELKGE